MRADIASAVWASDAKTGKLGEKVDTLISAVALGKSITWPRPSYDGRYLMFTTLDYGYFSIWHPEADLWLLDLKTGKAHALDAANSDDSDSFHNWSKSGGWYVFTSRREDGLYTRIYLASVDRQGHSSSLSSCRNADLGRTICAACIHIIRPTSRCARSEIEDIPGHINNPKRTGMAGG